jgi:hypothetical protein
MRTFVIPCYFGSVSKSGSAKAKVPAPTGSGSTTLVLKALHIPSPSRADHQRRGSILTWIVILSVYGADTIAEVKLLISPFLR